MSKTIIISHETREWTDDYVTRLGPMFPAFDFRAAYSLDEARQLAPEAHAIIGMGPHMPADLIGAMPRLEWVQTLTTGIDNFRHMDTLRPGIPVTRVTGKHGPQVSETAILLMMALARRLPDTLAAQRDKRWDRRPQPVLAGKTLCIFGLGSIAETLALYADTMGMRVTGISDGRSSAPHVSRIYPRADLAQAVGEADFLVVLVPLTEATRNIINADVLAAMKPTAFLVNVARGGCVDEPALRDALVAGQIAGAGMDVFAQEPLPADDPMWTAPNTIITPHIAGFADVYAEQCLPVVINNLTIYAQQGTAALPDALKGQ